MISIVVPAWNEEKRIDVCLRALRAQTYRGKKEIIVVDDGSTDQTAQRVKAYKGVKLITKSHAGPAAARNAGATAARGKIILFTDADCEPEPTWVERMVESFVDPTVWGVQGIYQSKQQSVIAKFTQLEIEERYARMSRFPTIDFIGTYAAGYRKEIFEKFGGFDATFPHPSGEDSEFSFRLAKAGGKLVLNTAAVVNHEHPSTLRAYLRTKFYRAYWRVLLYRKHTDKAFRETYTPQGLKLQIGLFGIFLLSLLSTIVTDSPNPAIVSYILFVGIGLPTAMRMVKKDLEVGIASLGILQLRSIVFALGLAEGIIAQRRKS